MPRTNKIAPADELVCKRLGQLRRDRKFTRPAFCALIGIGEAKYANYELVRVPVPFAVADAICSKLDVSQAWLGEGREPIGPYVEIPKEWRQSINPRASFYAVYEGMMREYFPIESPELALPSSRVKVSEAVQHAWNLTPVSLRREFEEMLLQKLADFRARNRIRSRIAEEDGR